MLQTRYILVKKNMFKFLRVKVIKQLFGCSASCVCRNCRCCFDWAGSKRAVCMMFANLLSNTGCKELFTYNESISRSKL